MGFNGEPPVWHFHGCLQIIFTNRHMRKKKAIKIFLIENDESRVFFASRYSKNELGFNGEPPVWHFHGCLQIIFTNRHMRKKKAIKIFLIENDESRVFFASRYSKNELQIKNLYGYKFLRAAKQSEFKSCSK